MVCSAHAGCDHSSLLRLPGVLVLASPLMSSVCPSLSGGFPGGTSGKEASCLCRRRTRREFNPWVGQEDPGEKKMANHSSILAWRIPQTEEPGGYSQ